MKNAICHIYNFKVDKSHLDSFSHVNNAKYLELFEEARWDWVTKNGYGRSKIEETGLGPVILEINIKFKRELQEGMEININTEILEKGNKISKIRQQMIDSSKSVCCEAIFTFGLFNLKTRKIVKSTEEWQGALSPIKVNQA